MINGEGIAAIIGAAGGVAVTLSGSVFAQRRLTRKYKNTTMVSNFQELYNELRTDIGRLRDEQTNERKQWAEERLQFNTKIEALQTEIRQQDVALHKKDVKVVELNGKIETLTAQLEIYKNESRHVPTVKKVSIET